MSSQDYMEQLSGHILSHIETSDEGIKCDDLALELKVDKVDVATCLNNLAKIDVIERRGRKWMMKKHHTGDDCLAGISRSIEKLNDDNSATNTVQAEVDKLTQWERDMKKLNIKEKEVNQGSSSRTTSIPVRTSPSSYTSAVSGCKSLTPPSHQDFPVSGSYQSPVQPVAVTELRSSLESAGYQSTSKTEGSLPSRGADKHQLLESHTISPTRSAPVVPTSKYQPPVAASSASTVPKYQLPVAVSDAAANCQMSYTKEVAVRLTQTMDCSTSGVTASKDKYVKILGVLRNASESVLAKDIAQKSGYGSGKSDVNRELYRLQKEGMVEKIGNASWKLIKMPTGTEIEAIAIETAKIPPSKKAKANLSVQAQPLMCVGAQNSINVFPGGHLHVGQFDGSLPVVPVSVQAAATGDRCDCTNRGEKCNHYHFHQTVENHYHHLQIGENNTMVTGQATSAPHVADHQRD